MKLLIVTAVSSIHAARWVNQLKDTGWEVHVFQAEVGGTGIHSEFEFGVFHVPVLCPGPKGSPVHVTLPENYGLMNSITKLEAKRPGLMQAVHELYLEDLIRRERPDIVHSLGLNINWTNMCLPVLRVKTGMGEEFPCPWLYSSWGTDLSFYAQLSEQNLADVKSVLKNCDYLITEHSHDRDRANELGFTGTFVGHFTGFGGIEEFEKGSFRPTSQRKTVLLKGRDIADGDPIGRASTAIRAFKLCQDVLKDYRIVVASASSSGFIMEEVALLTATTDLKAQALPYLSSQHLMEIYGASRIFISLTINDGIPRSLLEAMSCGAFPIVGDLDSFSDIVVNGKTGLLVPPEDPEAVATALRKALGNDAMVDKGAARNYEIISRKFSDKGVRRSVSQMYSSLARTGRQTAAKHVEEIKQALTEDGRVCLSPIEQAQGAGRIGLLKLISDAIRLNNDRVYYLLAWAMAQDNGRALKLIGEAMRLDNERVYDLLAWAIARKKERTLRLIEKALMKEDLVLFHILRTGFGCKCIKLASVPLEMLPR